MNRPQLTTRLRRMISHLHLPVPLNIFLFGFANRPLSEQSIKFKESPTTPLAKLARGRKSSSYPRLSLDTISASLDAWISSGPDLSTDFSIADLAREINVARIDLQRYFQSYLHLDFRVWKSELRLERAAEILLERPDMMISDICAEVGMNNISNFHRQFKKYKNCTPKQWRESHADGVQGKQTI